jgi:hypothetical protein
MYGMDERYKKIIDLLLRYGADPNSGNKARNYNITNAHFSNVYYLVDRTEITLKNLNILFDNLFKFGLTLDHLNEKALIFLNNRKNPKVIVSQIFSYLSAPHFSSI